MGAREKYGPRRARMSEYLDIPSLYGSSVFSDKEMRARLPREIYKRLAASIATGEELDPAVADATASAMKAWAIEQGATHYTHWFQPLTGTTAEKHDSFISPQKDGSVIMESARQGVDSRRAGRFLLPIRRHPRHVRGARLHRLGYHQPRVSLRQRRYQNAVHPHGVLRLQRRGARPENAAAALDGGRQPSGRAHLPPFRR